MFDEKTFAGLSSLEAKHEAELKARENDHEEANQINQKLIKEREEHLNKVAEIIKGKPENQKEQEEIYKIWRTIELGTGLKTAEDFEKALKEAGRETNSGAQKLLEVVEKEIGENSSYKKEEVDLVEATPAELGLPKGGTLEQIYEAAKKNGLEKCSEAGPQSAIQYEDQPKGEYRLIGVDNHRAFIVRHGSDGKRWLVGNDFSAGDVWYPDNPFVWVRRKKSELKS